MTIDIIRQLLFVNVVMCRHVSLVTRLGSCHLIYIHIQRIYV